MEKRSKDQLRIIIRKDSHTISNREGVLGDGPVCGKVAVETLKISKGPCNVEESDLIHGRGIELKSLSSMCLHPRHSSSLFVVSLSLPRRSFHAASFVYTLPRKPRPFSSSGYIA